MPTTATATVANELRLFQAASPSIDNMPTTEAEPTGHDSTPSPTSPSPTIDTNPLTIVKRHHVDLGDYLRYFLDEKVPTEEINYMKIMPVWNSPDNIEKLAVGSPLQRTDKNDIYPFISSLYTEARKCLEVDDDFRQAKVLILTAGLFEQCRVREVREVILCFGASTFTSFDDMNPPLPFMHRAHNSSLSEDVMKTYLQNIDWKKRTEELMRAEPILHIFLQKKGDDYLRKVTLNPLTTFKYLLKEEDIPAETLRISLKRNFTLMAVTYLPYAEQRTLSILGIKNNDALAVEEVECDSNSIDKFLLPTTNGCFDPSLKHWMPNTFNCLHEDTKTIADGHHQSLCQAVARFWSESSTGRPVFLSADTQMVCTFSSHANDPDGISYIRLCYSNAQHYFEEGRKVGVGEHNTAKSYVLTAGLMEQGQFTDIGKLLELYSTNQPIDEEFMRENHKWLYVAYVATKSKEALKHYLRHLDIEAQKEKVRIHSLCISLRFYHAQSGNYHMITVNPLVTLETLLGIHTNVSKFSYGSIRITMDDGRDIVFSSARRKTLAQLEIKNLSVLNLEDVEAKPNTLPELKLSSDASAEFVKEFLDRIRNLVHHQIKKSLDMMKPKIRQNLGENGSILAAISRYFLKPEQMKLLSADEMDKFEGNHPYDKLHQMAMEFMNEGAFFEAKVVALIAAFIEQCQLTGVYNAVVYMTSSNQYLSPTSTLKVKLEKALPICYNACVIVEKPDTLMNYLQKFDIYKHCNDQRGKEPRINMVFSNRANGIDQSFMSNVNAHMTFHNFVKKFAFQKHGKSLQSLRIAYNGCRVYISSCGKKSLRQLGMKDDDVVVVEDVGPHSNGSSTRNLTNGQRKGKTNSKKKNRGRAKTKNKPREQIVIPKTEEEIRKDHSKMMSPVLEQLERERLRKIRTKLNNLSIKKTSAKERRLSSREKKVDVEPVFNPQTEGLEGKAGKIAYPVLVGEVSNLYKTSKSLPRSSITMDLHGCSKEDALEKLDTSLPIWVDSAMKGEYPWVIPVDIICGGGSQILSEAVKGWIRTNRQVANRPKGIS